MRKNGESLDEDDKYRILEFCFTSVVTNRDELIESLSAVPPDDAWQTFLWLDDKQDRGGDVKHQHMIHEFIAANIAEISGDKQKSLDQYRGLQNELKNQQGSMRDSVNDAIARLSHG
jgi:hypothetical protein